VDQVTDFPYAGSVSHGTMRNIDLIDRFSGVLAVLDQQTATALAVKYVIPDTSAFQKDNFENELASEYVYELFDALDACAPEGMYFGAHEGDGSDYGFWPNEDLDDE
jgi:hypothetical protein